VNVQLFKGDDFQARSRPYRGPLEQIRFYSLAGLESGKYTLLANKVGYHAFRRTVLLRDSGGKLNGWTSGFLRRIFKCPK